jgi:hypothetical protein
MAVSLKDDVSAIMDFIAGVSLGIVAAFQFLTENWDALEADFSRFYGVDLRSVCWGSPSGGSRWPMRKLLTHFRGLLPFGVDAFVIERSARLGYAHRIDRANGRRVACVAAV